MHSKTAAILINKYQRCLFFLMVLLFPFTHFSLSLPVTGDKPYTLCILIGYAIFAYEILIKNIKLNDIEKFGFLFILMSVGWMAITGVIGVLNYQYYEYINLTQMDKFKNFFENTSMLFPLNEIISIKIWQSYKQIQESFLSVLYTYLVSLWIYHVYRPNWCQAFKDLRISIAVLCSLLFFYSFFEIDYLIGGNLGRIILEQLNPVYMKIADVHGWWPPLLWVGQVRSLFAEPSFLGIFCALAIPILSSFYFSSRLTPRIVFGIFLHMGMVLLIVLSKARTGTILFIGETGLIVFWFFLFNRMQWKRLLLLGTCIGLSFLFGLGIMSRFTERGNTGNQNVNVSIEGYIEQNVTSVVGNQRSNSSRKANVRATFKTGFEYPFFGIGHGLKDMYLDKNLSPEDLGNHEVANWSAYMYENGPLKSAYPTLNQLAGTLAEQGIPGLVLFIMPIAYIFLKIGIHRDVLCDFSKACTFIALVGLCMAFFSNVAMIYFYVLLGFMYIAINCNEGRD